MVIFVCASFRISQISCLCHDGVMVRKNVLSVAYDGEEVTTRTRQRCHRGLQVGLDRRTGYLVIGTYGLELRPGLRALAGGHRTAWVEAAAGRQINPRPFGGFVPSGVEGLVAGSPLHR